VALGRDRMQRRRAYTNAPSLRDERANFEMRVGIASAVSKHRKWPAPEKARNRKRKNNATAPSVIDDTRVRQEVSVIVYNFSVQTENWPYKKNNSE
jgi:hypothetical protein